MGQDSSINILVLKSIMLIEEKPGDSKMAARGRKQKACFLK
jgi:hypothetical protein